MPQYITMRELNAKAQELGSVGEALKWAKANGYEVDTNSSFAALPPEEDDGELPPISNPTASQANTLAVMPSGDAEEENSLAVSNAGGETPTATGGLSGIAELVAEAKGLPAKNEAAYKQIFQQGQDYISKMYPVPGRSQLLSSLSRALLSPTKYRGFAGTMYNVAGALGDIDKSREDAMRNRMIAEQKLQQTLGMAAAGDTTKALQLRYNLLKEEGDRAADLAKANAPVRGVAVGNRLVNPYTGEEIGPPIGTVKVFQGKQYRFVGGDQYDKNNWQEVR